MAMVASATSATTSTKTPNLWASSRKEVGPSVCRACRSIELAAPYARVPRPCRYFGSTPLCLEVVAEESASVEHAVSERSQSFESLGRIRHVQRLVEQQGQRSIERLARRAIRVRVVREQTHEVTGGRHRGIHAPRAHRILYHFHEELETDWAATMAIISACLLILRASTRPVDASVTYP